MIEAVFNGKPDTAMMAFKTILTAEEIEAVVDFVRQEFMLNKNPNTKYHTAENGWENHKKYAIAYPFALGEISMDTPWDELSPEQQEGKRLFMTSCITCHDRGKVNNEGKIWEPRPLSFPRNRYNHKVTQKQIDTDANSGASPYAFHDLAPQAIGLSLQEQQGQALFQRNCAFCHAADGTGKNWIGSFLSSHPRDLTSKQVAAMSTEHLKEVIKNGLPATTMSAWKSVLTDEQIEVVIAYIERVFIKRSLELKDKARN